MAVTAAIDSKRVNISKYPHDTCGVSMRFLREGGFGIGEPVFVRNTATGVQESLRMLAIVGVEDGTARLSLRLRTALGVSDGDAVEIESAAALNYTEVGLQLASNSGTAKVQIPEQDYKLIDKAYAYYRLICAGSGSELLVRTSDIEPVPAAPGKEHTIKLDRYQRKLLRMELPLEYSEALAAAFLGDVPEEDRAFVESCYENDALRDDISYADRGRAYKILCAGGFAHVYLAPFVQGKAGAEQSAADKGIGRSICDFYLRANEMTLRCVRPYDLEEGKQAVRLSEDTMALLGIEEGDAVRLIYGDREQRARALAMNSENEMHQTNLLEEGASFDNLVGIPAALRTNLGMNTINTSIAVKRDTRYLFKKHLNIQMVSLLAWLFTILQTVEVFGIDPIVATVVFVVLSPVILYVILSEERSRVRPLDS